LRRAAAAMAGIHHRVRSRPRLHRGRRIAARRARRMSAGRPLPTLLVAAALALGAAISLGLARFSYALLLPPMRADLGWSYFTAGAMNTVMAVGSLAGALAAPASLRRFGARGVFLGGAVLTALSLFAHGLVLADGALY